MRIAFYGGSFNPPHVGHALVASWVKWTGLAEYVWFCPTADHPFGKALLPFETRFRLCEAISKDIGNQNIRANDIEAKVPHEVSYTYLTLSHLRDKYGALHTFHPIMGADVLGDTSKWKYWDELEKEFPPIFVGRDGYPAQDSPTFPNISSTTIRNHIRNGEPLEGLVTQSVLELIKREGLYL